MLHANLKCSTCAIAAAGVAYRIPLLREQNQTKAIADVGLWTYV
jgi:hypothetical protein